LSEVIKCLLAEAALHLGLEGQAVNFELGLVLRNMVTGYRGFLTFGLLRIYLLQRASIINDSRVCWVILLLEVV